MRRQISILLILILGFYVMPSSSNFAYGNATSEVKTLCCKKEHSEADTKNCCKDGLTQTDTERKGCANECEDSSCLCPTMNISITFLYDVQEEYEIQDEVNYNDPIIVSYISTDFNSIWKPPKLS